MAARLQRLGRNNRASSSRRCFYWLSVFPTTGLDLAAGTCDLAVAVALAAAEATFVALVAHGLHAGAFQEIGAELARLHRRGLCERAAHAQACCPAGPEIALGAIDTRLLARAQSARLAVAPLAGIARVVCEAHGAEAIQAIVLEVAGLGVAVAELRRAPAMALAVADLADIAHAVIAEP